MIYLVTNADDFGLTEGVCSGIVKAIHEGGVTATTAMACVPGARERLARWAPLVRGHIGAHLQLTGGIPALDARVVPTLVEENGMFPPPGEVRARNTDEILGEWRAQIEVLLKLGIEPTHLDSHHHVHGIPEAFPAFCEIARQYRIPARALDPWMTARFRQMGIACADKTLLEWYEGDLSVSGLLALMEEGTRDCGASSVVEVMCHPALVDDDLRAVSDYVDGRERELQVLCDMDLQNALTAAGFRLCAVPEAFLASRHS
ncbi:MAG TPA: ChbG/HpnK family deacetylase [Bryobacteraceae bacterium]|nr:ChbG/HpnK family deacetylase [Bryobacteraceae bacterium]